MDNIIYSPSGAVSLHISEDKMSAWISIQKTERMIDEHEILDLIDNSGICYGFEDALNWIADNGMEKDFNTPFPVAICKPSQSEQLLNLHFDKQKAFDPEIEFSFNQVKDCTFVPKDAVLADISYNLFLDGGSIYNIFGELTSNSSNTIDLSHYLGHNVHLDGDKIIATTTGYPYVDKDGRICIIDNLVFNGDVRNNGIPITLAASLTVNGSILGANLSILKDLSVSGDITNTQLYIEGNLDISGSIISCQPAGILVNGDITVLSIIDSLVICNGKLIYHNLISGSKVIAEKQVSSYNENGTIYGSMIQTAGFIEAACIGNADEIETELEITISPFIKERMIQLTKALIKQKEMPDENVANIDNLENELHNLEIRLSDDLNIFLNTNKANEHYVKASDDIYPGVSIRILKHTFTIKKYQSGALFQDE